jgi:arsenate reductase
MHEEDHIGSIIRMNILVLCTGNSCRSQIAEGWLRHGATEHDTVYSAGVNPHGVNPRAVAIMKEAGIDISGQTSNHVDEYLDTEIDVVLTVCDNAKEHCPAFPKKVKTIHHAFDDPSFTVGTEEEIMSEFRRVRDEIRTYAEKLIVELRG